MAVPQAITTKTASGRTPLPSARPTSVGMARDTSRPSGSTLGPIQMERQISKPYLDAASSAPYVDQAEAEHDQRSAIKEVNSKSVHWQHLAKSTEREKKPYIANFREREAVEALLALMNSHRPQQQVAGKTPWGIKSREIKLLRGIKSPRGIKLPECDKCGKGFSRSEHLRRHARTKHLKEMEAKCSRCHKGFSRRDNCLVHVRKCSKEGDTARVINLPEDPRASSASTVQESSGPPPERAQSSIGPIAYKALNNAGNRSREGPIESVDSSRGLQYPGTKFTPINRVSGLISSA
ncbi:hypothetical protein VMCG_04682 [Cytospora schulzeri]|uniref:C2H2-type domain-containing protein n=1 Tax=Cytospora schulzeri TaxID=448051 RepID=A0A423WRT1_9PEZI|nr:hypothetical protein VMCG_04682 [Valsa malicola]